MAKSIINQYRDKHRDKLYYLNQCNIIGRPNCPIILISTLSQYWLKHDLALRLISYFRAKRAGYVLKYRNLKSISKRGLEILENASQRGKTEHTFILTEALMQRQNKSIF